MKKFYILWVNSGRIEVLIGFDLKNAFSDEGLLMWFYKTEIYKVLQEEKILSES